jgi:hypothetical protein
MIIPPRISYDELLKTNPWPSYKELLNTIEWGNFRLGIIERDKRCGKCNVEIEGDEGKYYRRLTSEEISQHDKEWENDPGIDLMGDGKHIVKGQKVEIVGIPLIVQVHHKYYIQNKLPWDYNEKALLCLCRECHVKIHASEEILRYTDDTLSTFEKLQTCSVCSGTGYREQYDYYQNGICFYCDGKGFNETTISA